MPRRPRSMRRREAIALTAMGIGPWGEVAKAADTVTLTFGGAAVNVRFGPGDFDLPRDELMGWISTAACAVTVYYGRFPVSTAAIEVIPATDKAGVLGGVTYGAPARTQITVGQHTSARQLEHDWTMTHELVHMAFPSVAATPLDRGGPRYLRGTDRGSPVRESQRGESLGGHGATCHRVNPDRATVVSTVPATGGAPTGAARYSVCLPMCSSGSGRETAVACSMRYEAFWPPAVTLTASGQWNEP
jgi:hypothetical protein